MPEELPETTCKSKKILVLLAPQDIAMFRFLLEAHENLALFTVLERKTALLKIIFSPDSQDQLFEALTDIERSLSLKIMPWPINGIVLTS